MANYLEKALKQIADIAEQDNVAKAKRFDIALLAQIELATMGGDYKAAEAMSNFLNSVPVVIKANIYTTLKGN